MADHPYINRPPFTFWRRSIAQVPSTDVDPVISSKFRISSNDKVVTAGSCFAQHIARHLKASGFNFYVTETPHPIALATSANDFGYGLYSARYGNVYTSRQLLQLIQRSYGLFKPDEDFWLKQDGRLVDPFRPTIQPNGFVDKTEYNRDREQHFAAVRQAVENMDVFVFTLGLTETWVSRVDDAAYPICPGVSGGAFDPSRYEYTNLTVREVVSDLEGSIELIRKYNQHVKIILTVSPVPLVATMEDESVLAATTYSKSVLRVAADEMASADMNIAYFPSYEIITGTYSRGKYFGSDLRSVTEEGVAHVMRLFMKHYASSEDMASSKPLVPDPERATATEEIAQVMCDEEALDRINAHHHNS